MNIKDKIEKLLAKAESTDNEHERDAFTAQAERLMLKWGIEAADLEARGEVKPEEIVEEHRVFTGSYAIQMPAFATAIALGLGNIRVLKSGNRNHWLVFAIGHKTDVAHFWTLVESLDQQAQTARAKWWKTAPEKQWLTPWEGYLSQRNFITAFSATVSRRLRELRTEIQVEATPGAALVLVSKKERVDAWVDDTYSNLRNARSLASGSTGYSAGASAGQSASLGEKSIGGTTGALR